MLYRQFILIIVIKCEPQHIDQSYILLTLKYFSKIDKKDVNFHLKISSIESTSFKLNLAQSGTPIHTESNVIGL